MDSENTTKGGWSLPNWVSLLSILLLLWIVALVQCAARQAEREANAARQELNDSRLHKCRDGVKLLFYAREAVQQAEGVLSNPNSTTVSIEMARAKLASVRTRLATVPRSSEKRLVLSKIDLAEARLNYEAGKLSRGTRSGSALEEANRDLDLAYKRVKRTKAAYAAAYALTKKDHVAAVKRAEDRYAAVMPHKRNNANFVHPLYTEEEWEEIEEEAGPSQTWSMLHKEGYCGRNYGNPTLLGRDADLVQSRTSQRDPARFMPPTIVVPPPIF